MIIDASIKMQQCAKYAIFSTHRSTVAANTLPLFGKSSNSTGNSLFR